MNKKQVIRLTESQFHQIIKESVERVLREGKIPSYNEPVFINCKSQKDADMSVEIGYSDYSSSLFYVGDCGTDGYAALETVVEYLVQNRLIDYYTGDEELATEYPDDFIEVDGYPIQRDMVAIHQLIGNHGERRF